MFGDAILRSSVRFTLPFSICNDYTNISRQCRLGELLSPQRLPKCGTPLRCWRSDSRICLLDARPRKDAETCADPKLLMEANLVLIHLHYGISDMGKSVDNRVLLQLDVGTSPPLHTSHNRAFLTSETSLQRVQGLSGVSTSVRFLPNIIIGAILNIFTGAVIHKFSAYYILLLASFLSIGSPILLAIIDPKWSYWYGQFWAILLSPLAADGTSTFSSRTNYFADLFLCTALFVISNIIITTSFPASTQALAGAVFNTVSQFGTAVGLAIMAVISSTVTDTSSIEDKNSPEALLKGYRASFWACFGATVLTCVVGAGGLRRVGRVGVKEE